MGNRTTPDGRVTSQPHHQGSYKGRARRVREAAYRDPTTRCWRCGLTLEEKQRTRPGDTWQAGHLVDGEVDGALAAEHRSCNAAAGARARRSSRLRGGGYQW